MRSKFIDSLSDRKFQTAKRQEDFDEWAGSGATIENGIWRDKETGKIIPHYHSKTI